MNNRKPTMPTLCATILTAIVLSVSVISAQAAGTTHTLTSSGTNDWSTATWTNGAPGATSAGDSVTYAPSATAASTTTLDVSGVVFGQISGFQTFASPTVKNWVINSGAGTSFTLDNTGGTVNPFGNFDASISSSPAGSLLTINPDIVIQNTNLSIGALQNLGVIINGTITASSARTLTLVNNSNSSGGVFELNGSIGATGSSIAIQTAHTTNGGFSFPIVIKGALGTNVTSLTHNAATDLQINYANTASELINDATPVSLGYGARYTQANSTTSTTTETVNSFGLAGGQSTLTISGGLVNVYPKLDIGAFTRNNNATALVRGTNLGLAATTSSAGSRITVGSGLVQIGTNTSSLGAGSAGTDKQLTIVPYFIGATVTSGSSAVGTNFLTLDTNGTTGGLRLLSANEQATVAAAVSGDNVKTTGVVNTAGTQTYNSLLITGAAVSSLTGDNTGALNITSGALASVMSSATGDFDLSGFTGIVFGTTGANEAVITNTNATAGGVLTIASPISTATLGGGLTKAGEGTVVLAADNTYTGPTTINQSVLQVGNGTTGSLNSASIITTAAGDTNTAEARRGILSLNLANNGVMSNAIVNNGAIVKTAGANVNEISGDISGTGGVAISLSGSTLVFSGDNTYGVNGSPANGLTSFTGPGTLRAVANTGNTTAGVSSALSANSYLVVTSIAAAPAALELRADESTTFGSAGLTFGTVTAQARGLTINVDRATGSGLSNQVITLGGNVTNPSSSGTPLATTLTVTGGNGYSLALGRISNGNQNGMIVNTVGANLSIASLEGNTFFNGVSTNTAGGTYTFTGDSTTTILAQAIPSNASRTQTVNIGTAGLNDLTGAVTMANSATSGGNGLIYNLNSGTLNVNTVNGLGGGSSPRTLNINPNATTNPKIDTTSGDIAVTNGATNKLAVNINGDFTFGGTNNLNLGTGATTLGTAAGTTRTITANGTTKALTLGGIISNGTTANSITKDGTGTVILGGANAYTGLTTVQNGTLLVNSTGSINSSSNVAVTGGTFRYDGTTALTRDVSVNGGKFSYNSVNNYGGTLSFTAGTIGGSNISNLDLTFGTGQTMSPGNSTGTMAAGATTWANGGTFLFEVNDATGTAGSTSAGWDLLNAASLNITAGVGAFTIEIASLDALQAAGLAQNFNGANNYSWLFVDAGADITSFNVNQFVFTDSFSNPTTGTFSISQGDGLGGDLDKLYINYTGVIPEPSTYALLVGGLGLLAFLRRRKQS